jgi:hypothetical protein
MNWLQIAVVVAIVVVILIKARADIRKDKRTRAELEDDPP